MDWEFCWKARRWVGKLGRDFELTKPKPAPESKPETKKTVKKQDRKQEEESRKQEQESDSSTRHREWVKRNELPDSDLDSDTDRE